MTFWDTATREQKLAQIDGGIECGMTAKQIAMCLGAPSRGAVQQFAYRHGRPVPYSDERRAYSTKIAGRTGGIGSAREGGTPDYEIHSAFSIFDTDDQDETFLEEVA